MLAWIKEFFLGDPSVAIDASGRPSGEDLQLATGVLLLEIAAADNEVVFAEERAIFNTLREQFDIQKEEIDQLVEVGRAVQENPQKVTEFIKLINKNFADEQRRLILAMIWKVIIADNKIDDFEKKLAFELASRLKLKDEDARRARQMAEKGDV